MATSIEPTIGRAQTSREFMRQVSAEQIIFKTLRLGGLLIGALLLGLPGLFLLFPSSLLIGGGVAAVVYFLLAGLLIGRIGRKQRMLSGLVAWGEAMLTSIILTGDASPVTELSEIAFFIGASVGPAKLGGYLGSRLWGKVNSHAL
jgi:hypothetical protein